MVSVTCVGAHLVNTSVGTALDVTYWRERNHEVDFVLQRGTECVAIEVKSGRRRESLPGMATFAAHFSPKKSLLVGAQGINGMTDLRNAETSAVSLLQRSACSYGEIPAFSSASETHTKASRISPEWTLPKQANFLASGGKAPCGDAMTRHGLRLPDIWFV